MNRKKTIDYTVTRRPREHDSSNSRQDSSSKDGRGRGNGDMRSKTPFWSNNDENLFVDDTEALNQVLSG